MRDLKHVCRDRRSHRWVLLSGFWEYTSDPYTFIISDMAFFFGAFKPRMQILRASFKSITSSFLPSFGRLPSFYRFLLQGLQGRGEAQLERAAVLAVGVVARRRDGAGALPGGRVAGRGAVVGAERGGQVVQAERLGELRVEQRQPGDLHSNINCTFCMQCR